MWQTNKNSLDQTFRFNSFDEAIDFINKVAKIARSQNHHPEIRNVYDTVELSLSTHEAGDTVTDKDHALAAAIDEMLKPAHEQTPAAHTPENEQHFIKLYGDGGSRGNPGPSASGFVLYDADDNVLLQKGVYLGITTNNQAEYQSLRLGLEAARAMGAREVAVHMDSLLVINQMKGIFKVKNRDLWPIYQSIKTAVEHFDKVSFTHVPRELNKMADSEVNKALDIEAGK